MQDGSTVDITGEKSFVNLSTKHLLGLNTINGIDIDDFIILNRHEIIDEEIVFENLEIIEDFKVRFNKYVFIYEICYTLSYDASHDFRLMEKYQVLILAISNNSSMKLIKFNQTLFLRISLFWEILYSRIRLILKHGQILTIFC